MPGLFVELHSHQLRFLRLQLVGFLARARRVQQPVHRVQRPIRVIRAERLLVRPLVPDLHQLTHDAPLRPPQRLPEDLIPALPHQPQQTGRIPIRCFLRAPDLDALPEHLPGRRQPLRAVRVLKFPLHIRRQPRLQYLQRLPDPLMIA